MEKPMIASAELYTRWLLSRYVRNRRFVQPLMTAGFIAYIVIASVRGFAFNPRRSSKRDNGKSSSKAAIDPAFYTNLSTLLRIVIPSLRSKETLMLTIHSALLIFRTALSLYVASLDGKIVTALVKAQPFKFVMYILRWLLVAIPATWANSWLSYIQNKLAMAYRTRLTEAILKQYLGNSQLDQSKLYYKIANLDDRITNPDQMITVDIQRFSTHLAAVYSNLAKPILDVVLYSHQLSRNVGAEGLVLLIGLVQASAALLRVLTPAFGQYAAEEAALSGVFHQAHSRLSEYSEEIAFFGGEIVEKTLIEKYYFRLMKHMHRVSGIKAWHGIVEEGIIKWLWGSFGLCICAIPVFSIIPGFEIGDVGNRTGGLVTNRRLLLSASDAFGRVMYSYKELSELAGYTQRVSSFMETLNDAGRNKFIKFQAHKTETDLMLHRGKVIESDTIEFKEVPIITPNGDMLVPKLSFYVNSGEHLLIVGPNGCGKSSLFRILGGLWPVYGGVVKKPRAEDFILIPQRPYLSLGTLRDQVIYPHSVKQMEDRGHDDASLEKILRVVGLHQIPEREGGWEATKEWRDSLSGGDKQKIAWARLFYHAPKYAILDEATSLIPVELEGCMMEHATSLGITLLTVSHRPSLWKYHKMILHYDGVGGYIFTKLDAERRLRMQEEKQELEARLTEIPKLSARLEELKELRSARS